MKQTLTLEQCKALLRVIAEHGSKNAKAVDHALVVSVLMCGADARTWTWQDALANPIFQPFAVYEAIKNIAISKKLSIFPFNHAGFQAAHWLHATVRLQQSVFTVGSKPLTTQEVTRRLKRYGKLAGISAGLMNLRTLSNSHQMYLEVFGDADSFAEALEMIKFGDEQAAFSPFSTHKPKKADGRLHGINRRSIMPTR